MNTYEYKNDVKNSIVRVIIAALLIIIQVFMIVNLAIHLSEYYVAFDTIMSIIAFICVLHIYGRPDNSAFKLSWIVLILIFPVFGLAIYILFGRPSLLKTVQKKFNKVMMISTVIRLKHKVMKNFNRMILFMPQKLIIYNL